MGRMIGKNIAMMFVAEQRAHIGGHQRDPAHFGSATAGPHLGRHWRERNGMWARVSVLTAPVHHEETCAIKHYRTKNDETISIARYETVRQLHIVKPRSTTINASSFTSISLPHNSRTNQCNPTPLHHKNASLFRTHNRTYPTIFLMLLARSNSTRSPPTPGMPETPSRENLSLIHI